MRTHGTETEAERTFSSPHPRPIYRQGPPVQPPSPDRKGRGWIIGTLIAVVLVVLVSMSVLALAQLGYGSKSQATPTPQGTGATIPATRSTTGATPTAPGTTVPTPSSVSETTPIPPAGVRLGPVSCPEMIKDNAYWDHLLGTRSGTTTVERVSCANIVGNTSLQALVTVRHSGPDARLDVAVYDQITASSPQRVFLLSGLIKGDARISQYNTLLTAEVDVHSALNQGKPEAQWRQDLFREFAWKGQAGTLVQTVFPGIFPDLTRWQAEADQNRVNKGYDAWKYDASQVARALATKFFQWPENTRATVKRGGGPSSVDALIEVRNPEPGHDAALVTLSRLYGKPANIWEAIEVRDASALTMSNPAPHSTIKTPVKISGTGSAFEAVIGQALILDHLYTDIGHARVVSANTGMGKAAYVTQMPYQSTFQQGVQEGVVEVQLSNGGIGPGVTTAVMVKVLLSSERQIASGPFACPDAVQSLAYWNGLLGLRQEEATVTQVSCGNLKGDTSAQAVLTVFSQKKQTIDEIIVYDRILDRHPVQLFKLQGLIQGNARVSDYNTLMTAQVDTHSRLNQGKLPEQWQQDLFREFAWQVQSQQFVQAAFPGIFPDLTRWQAVDSQWAVLDGQTPWKNDAEQVARMLPVRLFQWPTTTTTKLLSGGQKGAVDAVVQVSRPGPGHPTLRVTLSRLYGDAANIWEVIRVQTDRQSITAPPERQVFSSPVTVTGTGIAFEGQVGILSILDHQYTAIGQHEARGSGMGPTSFSTQVAYRSSFQGVQEGVLALTSFSAADGTINAITLHKALLRA